MLRRSNTGIVEDLTIQPVPTSRRTGSPRHLFAVWFGVQVMPLTLVTGVLGPAVFGLGTASSIIAIVVGNLIGALFMALHSVQGARLGVPQMVQARGQFGFYGSLLVLVVVILMYLGFLASIVVLAGDTLTALFPSVGTVLALAISTVITLAVVVFGYDVIHRVNRLLLGLFALAVVLIAVYTGLAAGNETVTTGSFSWVGFVGMASTAAIWQIAYAPYVSDYSRYLPDDASPASSFGYTYGGAVIGAVPMMVLGTLLVTVAGGDGSIAQLGDIMPAPVKVFVLIMLFLGAIDAAVINLYGPSLCSLAIAQTFRPSWSPGAAARNTVAAVTALIAFIVAVRFADDFLVNYSNFIHFLTCLLIPWSIVNLADYYLVSRGRYDVAAFNDPDAGYGRFNLPALLTYLIGFVVQLPFMAGDFYTGWVAERMDSADLSWLVGSVVSLVVYLLLVRSDAFQRTPDTPEPINA